MASSTRNVPDIHLITGGTGAGKTTYALWLADEIDGVRFSIDDWMTTLFWMDSPDPISFEWAMTRINRTETQMWDMAEQVLSRGTPVIFDLGFTKFAHREKFRALAKTRDITAKLHWVDITPEERWRRVEARNAEKGETFAMHVSEDMFAFMENEWESPESEPHIKALQDFLT